MLDMINNFKSLTDKISQLPTEEQKRWRILLAVSPATLGIFLMYSYRYITFYHTHTYDLVFSTFIVLALISNYWIFKFSYLKASISFITISTVFMLYFLWVSGGVNAPGVFWLAIIPVYYSILLGRKGSYYGFGVLVFSIVLFFILGKLPNQPNIVALNGTYLHEKKFNIIFFSFMNSLFMFFYIRNNELAYATINDKKGEVDNLVRLLVHDIANPVTSMSYYTEKLINKHTEDEVVLKKIAKNIDNIINQISSVRQIKAAIDGKTELDLKPVDIVECIDDAITSIEEKLKQSRLVVVKNIRHNNNLALLDKSIFTNQILVNILTNAIKFSPENTEITVDVYQKENKIVVKIQDNGIGMPEAIIKNIFEFNKKTNRRGLQGQQGTGYGMPLVYTFIKKMNSTITAVSYEKSSTKQNSGTCFTMCIPLAPTQSV